MTAIKSQNILLRLLVTTGLLFMTLLPVWQGCGSIFADCAMAAEQVKSCCPDTDRAENSGTLTVLIPGLNVQNCHPGKMDGEIPCNCDCALDQTASTFEQPLAFQSQPDTGLNLIQNSTTESLSFPDAAHPHSGLTAHIPNNPGSPPLFIRNCSWLI